MHKPGKHWLEKDLAWPVTNGQLPYHIHHLSAHVHWMLFNCPSPPLYDPNITSEEYYWQIWQNSFSLSVHSILMPICHLYFPQFEKIAQETRLLIPSLWIKILNNEIQIEEKSQTNATNATLHPLMQVLWGHIWKRTVGKSQTSATSVTLHTFRQAPWKYI